MKWKYILWPVGILAALALLYWGYTAWMKKKAPVSFSASGVNKETATVETGTVVQPGIVDAWKKAKGIS